MVVAQANGPAQVPVALSPNGRLLLTTDDQHAGLYLTSTVTQSTRVITRSRNAGYYPTFSSDGSRVGYKIFRPNADGEYEQAAMVYDIEQDRSYQLGPWSTIASTPAFSPDGSVAVMLDGRLHVTSALLDTLRVLPLAPVQENPPNLLAYDPQGELILVVREGSQALLLSAQTGELIAEPVLAAPLPIWGPVFAPDGRRIAFSTINGKLLIWDRSDAQWLGPIDGETPAWLDSSALHLVAEEGNVRRVDVSGPKLIVTDSRRVGERWWATSPGIVASQMGERLVIQESGSSDRVITELTWIRSDDPEPTAPTRWPENMKDDGFGTRHTLVETDGLVKMTGVPYIHQVYDVPDWFDGHWACNAVVAITCLAYWDALQPNPITVSRPEPRPSNFATYICERYTRGSTSFDVASPDPKGRDAWGAYGYIVRENWKDTKNHIADYMEVHGVASGVDWSPSMAKLRSEIAAQHPTIILQSLTLAGHYVVGIGYLKGKDTVISNDPYGDKNTRLYPHIDGRGARYDMPGSNNGYQNFRVVHCLIYSRGPKESTGLPAGH